MITVLLVMLSGIFIGFAVNRFPRLLKINDRLISGVIYVLLFLLGISVGLNKTIIQNLDKIGVQAIIITVGAISGSVFILWLLYKFMFKSEHITSNPNEE